MRGTTPKARPTSCDDINSYSAYRRLRQIRKVTPTADLHYSPPPSHTNTTSNPFRRSIRTEQDVQKPRTLTGSRTRNTINAVLPRRRSLQNGERNLRGFKKRLTKCQDGKVNKPGVTVQDLNKTEQVTSKICHSREGKI